MSAAPRPDLADLLAHAAGLEDLARRLVGAGAAADLVQETWLRALMRPPRESGPLGPWLRTVLRRLARDRKRGDATRRARDAESARPEGGRDTHELVARAELHELLIRTLLALPEPYRDVLLLRYFEGASPSEIAERRGVPASTVRTWIERGLARLREQLDARPGGREAWHGMVVAVLGPVAAWPLGSAPWGSASGSVAASAGPIVVSAGVLVMKSVAIAALGAAVLGVATWTVVAGGGERRREVGAEVAHEPSPVAAAEPRDVAASAGEARRVVEDVGAPVAVAVDPARALGAATAAAPDAFARLQARLVDRTGAPLAGARMKLVLPAESTVTAESDGRGEVEAVTPLEPFGSRYAAWEASAAAHATLRGEVVLERGATVSLGTLELGPGGTIEGHVVLPDGRPAADATVVAVHPVRDPGSPAGLDRFGSRSEDRLLRVDALGAFRIDGVPEGSIRVWAKDPSHDWTASDVLEVAAGAIEGPLTVALSDERKSVITGRVLAPDGTPVPGARVHHRVETAEVSSVSSLTTANDGSFVLHVQFDAPHDLTAADPAGRHGDAGVRGVAPGTTGLELKLAIARHVTLRVSDPAGRPIERFAVEGHSRSRSSSMMLFEVAEELRPDGTLELRLPAVPFDLVVTARGHERLEHGRLEPESTPDRLDVVLRPVPAVAGVVRFDGKSVAGAEVSLWRLLDDSQEQLVDELRTVVATPTLDTVSTDDDGRFRLDLREGGRFLVRAQAAGFGAAELGPLALDASRDASGLEVTLVRGGAIEGRVLTPAGMDPEGTVVAFNHGDGKAFSVRVGADGAFRAEGLLPGGWQVRELESDLLPYARTIAVAMSRGPMQWDCTVADGATTRHDLDLRDRVPATLAGELRLAGVDLAGWVASLETGSLGPDVRSIAATSLDAAGRFTLDAPAGEYRLVLAGGVGGDSRLELSELVALAADGARWERELATGRLDGQVDLLRAQPRVRATLTPAGNDIGAALRFTARPDGSFGPLVLPVGEVLLRPAAAGDDLAFDVRRVELATDVTRRVDLP